MRLVCISDTHNLHSAVDLPDGDVLVHAGDFTNDGLYSEVRSFLTWLGEVAPRYRHTVLCAGNHDFLFQRSPEVTGALLEECAPGVIYLQDEAVEIDGVRFYGSPQTPWFYGAFNVHRGEAIRRYWDRIPEHTDVLITHSPPFGILDQATASGPHLGCEEMRTRVGTLPQVQVHIFGHIHGGHGVLARDGVTYINASICDEEYRTTNSALIHEIQARAASHFSS